MSTMEINTAREQQLFNGKNFHVFIYNKTESISGLHQHDYYEFTSALNDSYYKVIHGKRALLERADFVSTSTGSYHQSFYAFGPPRILNGGLGQRFVARPSHSLVPHVFVASQVYPVKHSFLSYIESVIASLHFRDSEFDEFIEQVTFYVINRLRHHREEPVQDAIPSWLKATVEVMHDNAKFGDGALETMVRLSGKSQEYLTRACQRYYAKTPMQIINDIRIDFAKKQLEITNYSVTDIAYDAGYSSPSLFIKTFKKLTSFTPSNYRKKLTEIN